MGSNDLYEPFFCDKEWEEYILFNLAKWENGFPFRKKDFSQEGIPIIKISELKNGITTNTNFTDKYFDEKYFLKRNDLLFSWSGSPETSIDVFWFKLKNGWLNQHIFKVYPKEQIVDKKFLYYLLKYLKPNLIQIAKNKQTTGLGHVTIEDLKKIKVKLPYLSEQQKIASILSAFDDKIHLNNEMNKTLEEIAQVIFKQWFIDFEFPNENGEPYKSSGGEFVDSELGPIPKGWEIKKLGDCISFIKGRKPKKIFKKNIDGYMEYLTIDVLNNNRELFASPESMITVDYTNNMMVMDGASSGSIYFGFKGIVASTIAKIEVIDNELNDDIIYFVLKNYENDIKSHTTGTAIPHVDKDFVKRLYFVCPSDNKIVEKYSALARDFRKKIYKNHLENRTLSQLRDTLLPRLISGEIKI